MTETESILNILKKVSSELQISIFLVGGFVRDYYLDFKSADLDIVLEESRDTFIEQLKKNLIIEKIIYHEDFGTATLYLEDFPAIDIAFARREIYPFPGSLPVVTFPVSIEEDLKRRDFSVNAMAINISTADFCLLDPFSGLDDLSNKLLRVLHAESFKDDPTRIFRGIRFAARWHFKFEKETERLLIKAVIRNYLLTISKDRIIQEFCLILNEKTFISSLYLLDKYKLFNFIHAGLEFNKDTLKKIRNTFKHPLLIKHLSLENHLLISLSLIYKKNLSEKINFFQTLNLSDKKIQDLIWTKEEEIEVLNILKTTHKNSVIFNLLKNRSPYFLFFLFMRADKRERKKIRKFMFNLKKITAIIDGKILISQGLKPGKEFKKILKKAFLIQLDMKYPSEIRILKELKLK